MHVSIANELTFFPLSVQLIVSSANTIEVTTDVDT